MKSSSIYKIKDFKVLKGTNTKYRVNKFSKCFCRLIYSNTNT